MFVSSCGMSDSTHPEVIDNIFFDDSIELNEDSTYYKITSPNGGEVWDGLSSHLITWETSGEVTTYDSYYDLHVCLYYSLDGGEEWIELKHRESNSNGEYTWTLPEIFITTTNCRVKVQKYFYPHSDEYFDISDGNFTISASGAQSDLINIINANGGEAWQEKTSEDITWTTNGDIGGNEVYIGYSTDGGNYWKDAVVGSNNSSEETIYPPKTSHWDETANDGNYTWTLPNFSDTLNNCIIGVWSAGNTALYDISDDYFTINCDSNYYRILHPNGGETFQMETERVIIWESGGDVGSVSLWYSEYGGDSWYLIDDNETNDGSYVWFVPTLQSNNSNCLIKIEDSDNSGWFDISDANFTIADTVIFDFDMSFETGESLAGWTFGDAWTADSWDAYSGSRSAVCQGGDGTLSKTMTVNSGVMRFFYRTKFYSYSCSYDYLALKIDGEEIFKVCEPATEIDWTLFEYYVDSGTYVFEWKYNSAGSSYYARIDAISFP